jgi:hypothetical protein
MSSACSLCAEVRHTRATTRRQRHLVDLGSDSVARRLVESLPAINQALQFNVKRCQEVTLDALKMQRICRAALLPVVAIAYVFSVASRIAEGSTRSASTRYCVASLGAAGPVRRAIFCLRRTGHKGARGDL